MLLRAAVAVVRVGIVRRMLETMAMRQYTPSQMCSVRPTSRRPLIWWLDWPPNTNLPKPSFAADHEGLCRENVGLAFGQLCDYQPANVAEPIRTGMPL